MLFFSGDFAQSLPPLCRTHKGFFFSFREWFASAEKNSQKCGTRGVRSGNCALPTSHRMSWRALLNHEKFNIWLNAIFLFSSKYTSSRAEFSPGGQVRTFLKLAAAAAAALVPSHESANQTSGSLRVDASLCSSSCPAAAPQDVFSSRDNCWSLARESGWAF